MGHPPGHGFDFVLPGASTQVRAALERPGAAEGRPGP